MLIIVPALVADGNEAPVSSGGHDGLSIVNLFIHLFADGFVHHLFVASCRCNELIPVCDQCRMAGDLSEAFRILLGKCGHLAYGRVFFQDDLSLLVGEDLQRV